MKKLLAGTSLALILATAPALADSTAKDHDSTLGSAKYMSTQPQAAAVATPAPAPAPAPAPQVAATPPPAPTPAPVVDTAETGSKFHGLYVGGQGNYIAGGSDVRGFGGGIFAGYGWTPNGGGAMKPYLGLETGFDWDGANSSTLAEKKDWSISLRPGLELSNDLLGYGILGYNHTNFKSNIATDDTWMNGVAIGAGLELLSSANLGLRLEYTYTDYNSSDLGGSSVKPHTNAIKVGALYRFQ